jgi:hypothetical protein
MGDRRGTDLHKPDGLIFQGEKIGHADKESRGHDANGGAPSTSPVPTEFATSPPRPRPARLLGSPTGLPSDRRQNRILARCNVLRLSVHVPPQQRHRGDGHEVGIDEVECRGEVIEMYEHRPPSGP